MSGHAPVAWLAVNAKGEPVPFRREGQVCAFVGPKVEAASGFPDWQIVPVFNGAALERERSERLAERTAIAAALYHLAESLDIPPTRHDEEALRALAKRVLRGALA